MLSARNYVVPDDVKAVAVSCLSHRLLTVEGDEGFGQAVAIVESLLEATPAPRP